MGQRIVVQLATGRTNAGQRPAPAVSVGGTTYSPPPEEQPDAPGTSITTITAKSMRHRGGDVLPRSTNGQANATKKLVVKVKVVQWDAVLTHSPCEVGHFRNDAKTSSRTVASFGGNNLLEQIHRI